MKMIINITIDATWRAGQESGLTSASNEIRCAIKTTKEATELLIR